MQESSLSLSTDQNVIEEGRKKTFEGKIPEASLRDQIPKKLLKQLNDLNIAEMVTTIWHQGNALRSERLETQRKLLAEIEEFIEPLYAAPYSWSSTLHMPISYTLCRTFHSRMNSAIMSMDPPFTVVARKEANSDRAPLIQEMMRYTINDWANNNKGIEETIDRWVWSWVSTGVGYMKYRWDEQYSRYMDVVEVQKPGPSQIQKDAQGQDVVIPTMQMVEEEQEVVATIFKGPKVELVQEEDLLIIGQDGDVDEADAVLHTQMLTASELWTLVDRGVFDKDAVEEIIAKGADLKASDANGTIKMQRADHSSTILDNTNELDRYRIVESYIRKDIDGSGINADLVVWIAPSSRQLCRATYLHRISKSGRRPFASAVFHRRSDNNSPIGLVELTYSLTKEIDTMHNMRVDFGLLSTLPFGFYRASSSMSQETMPLEPGQMIPLDNPQADVYFPNLGNRTSFGFQEEQALYSMVERMTSMSDLSLGVLGAQGASRTATGSRIVANESNTNLDIYLRRLNRGFSKLLQGLFEMVQSRIEPGFQFRLLGDDGSNYWATIQSKEEIAGMYDFELEANSSSSNKQIQMDTAQQLYQITGNPLDIQLGIISPQERYEALKNYLQTMGVKNYSKFIKKPQGGVRVFTPEELANRILAGIDVPLDPMQDLQGFAAYVQYIMDHDDLLGQFNQQQAIALAKKAQEAQQMMEAMAAQQAQQANAAQMQRNAAMASQQAGAGGAPQTAAPPAAPGA